MAERAEVVVIGAGPVGSLLALLLARRGLTVDIYERRPDQRRSGFSAGRSINLAVSTRGLHALHQVGLDQEVLQLAIPMFGRQTHAPDGAQAFLRYGADDSEFINSMSRGGLNALLLEAAEKSGRVRVHFEQRLVHFDPETSRARLRDERTGAEASIEAPVLIGTDGSASALRTALHQAGRLHFTEELLSSGYKELHLAPAPGTGQGPRGAFALEPHALHLWPRKSFMLIALPNQDGSFTSTLFLPFEGEGPSFARLVDAPTVEAFFAEHFRDVVPLVPGLAEAFLAAPLGKMVTVRADPWSAGKTLLVGDAAHAIVPFFGQGMNAGFEDCALLDLRLARMQEHEGRIDWERLFAEFSTDRKPDADAIAALALENHLEMRDKVSDPRFLFLRQLELAVAARLSGRYRTRYQLVTFSRVPYRVALEVGALQARILGAAAEGKTQVAEVDLSALARRMEDELLPLLARQEEKL